jgi:hypothetical protein
MSEDLKSRELTSARVARLQQALSAAQEVVFWRPEPGDTLVGELIGLKAATGPFGAGYQLIVRAQAGTYSLWLTGYLKSQIESYQAIPGDYVASST